LKPRKRKKKEITLKGDEEIDRSFFSLHLTWWRHVQRLRKHTVAPPLFFLFLVVLISITKLCDGEAVGHHTSPTNFSSFLLLLGTGGGYGVHLDH
jgi:hypothetical protein